MRSAIIALFALARSRPVSSRPDPAVPAMVHIAGGAMGTDSAERGCRLRPSGSMAGNVWEFTDDSWPVDDAALRAAAAGTTLGGRTARGAKPRGKRP